MNAGLPLPDLDECVRFAAFWRELTGAPHLTVTAITPDGPTATATFTRGQGCQLRNWIAEQQSTGRNIYFQPNETPPGCTKKPAKQEMAAALCRHADIDPDDEHFSLGHERDRLLRLGDVLRTIPSPPTAIIDSGNGLQPLWATTREPLTPEIIERTECENRAIEASVGASGTHNIDRLLRLPGTINFPNKRKRDLGREITRARLLHSLPAVYSAKEAALLGRHLAERLAKTDLVRSPPKDAEPRAKPAKCGHDDSRSAIAFRKGIGLRRQGCTFEQMCAALRADPETAEWYREKGDANGSRELHRIWDKAHETHDDAPTFDYDALVQRAASDAGAAFEPEALAALGRLRKHNPAEWQRLRERFKSSIKVTDLDALLDKNDGQSGGNNQRPPPQAEQLLAFAEGLKLFHDAAGTGYADIQVNGHRETWPIKSQGFRDWLHRRHYAETRRSVHGEALQDALNTIEARARFDGPEQPVHLRIAGHEGHICLDFCDKNWRAVDIGPDGWQIIDVPPVRFVRMKGMLPLPVPVRGGSIEELRPFLNIKTTDADNPNDTFILLVSWLLAAFNPIGAYLILLLLGEQGAAKTTGAALLRRLVDPNELLLRRPPRNEHDLAIAARSNWIVGFDNLSWLPAWLSDALCCLSTGSGFGTRTLYETAEETTFSAKRPQIHTGIVIAGCGQDFLDRSIVLTLAQIADGDRQTEIEFWAEFEQSRPRILGALLDIVAFGLKRLPTTKPKALPRMADAAKWAIACEEAYTTAGAFMRAFTSGQRRLAQDLIASDPVAAAISRMVTRIRQNCEEPRWEGTTTALLELLIKELPLDSADKPIKPKEWPANPTALGKRLTKISPALRQSGIAVERGHRADGEYITLVLAPR